MMNLLTVEAQKTLVVTGYLPSRLGVQVAQAKTRTEALRSLLLVMLGLEASKD